jgi:hypothetical protein
MSWLLKKHQDTDFSMEFDTAEEAVAHTHTVDSEVMISWYLEEVS